MENYNELIEEVRDARIALGFLVHRRLQKDNLEKAERVHLERELMCIQSDARILSAELKDTPDTKFIPANMTKLNCLLENTRKQFRQFKNGNYMYMCTADFASALFLLYPQET